MGIFTLLRHTELYRHWIVFSALVFGTFMSWLRKKANKDLKISLKLFDQVNDMFVLF